MNRSRYSDRISFYFAIALMLVALVITIFERLVTRQDLVESMQCRYPIGLSEANTYKWDEQ